MSYDEYLDLFKIAQENNNALYYVVSFDVVDSRKINKEKRKILQDNINIIIKYVYNQLLNREIELNKQVVIKDDRFIRPWDLKRLNNNGNYIDPLVFGDCFQFTVLRNTVSKEEIINWVEKCRKVLNMKESFHINDAYYETNNYEEGKDKLFRGYCLQILEESHKSETKKELKKLK